MEGSPLFCMTVELVGIYFTQLNSLLFFWVKFHLFEHASLQVLYYRMSHRLWHYDHCLLTWFLAQKNFTGAWSKKSRLAQKSNSVWWVTSRYATGSHNLWHTWIMGFTHIKLIGNKLGSFLRHWVRNDTCVNLIRYLRMLNFNYCK